MLLSPGQILNHRYRMVKLLGQGGFGAVYRAWDLNLERPRALKENLDTSPEAQRQFKREAQMLCDLTHPNLPKVIDHFVIPGQGQYLVMEFVEGMDLQEMLRQNNGPLTEAQGLFWIHQVCDALIYLHSQTPPVIHRDVKPANIRIAPVRKGMFAQDHDILQLPLEETCPYLVDFGIAKVFDPNLNTTQGARAVTPGYSPVEQYGQCATGVQSDVYALGATMYHLLTNLRPHASVDLMAKTTPPLLPANAINPAVSPQVGAAIQKAMQLERSLRWSSVAEFKKAMISPETVNHPQPSAYAPSPAAGESYAVQAPPVTRQMHTATSREIRNLPWRWIGIMGGLGLLGLILVAIVIGSFVMQGKNAPANVPPTLSAAILPDETLTAIPAESPVATSPGAGLSGITRTAQPTTTSQCKDLAKFVSETIPDHTVMAPGQRFTKMWRLANVGTCTWTRRYSFALFSGEGLNAVDSLSVPHIVAPGHSVDILLNMVAPRSPGVYQGNWEFKNEGNNWFGFGEEGKSAFWVRIVVVGATP